MKGLYKMNKSLLLASMMVVALAACGKDTPPHPRRRLRLLLLRHRPGAQRRLRHRLHLPTMTSSMKMDPMKADAMKIDEMKKDATSAVDAAKAQPPVKP